jgi:hypothetical protein
MNFSNDRDLLAHEPAVFAEAPFLSQQVLQLTDAAVAGTTLTSAAGGFVAAGVEGGSVVLIADVPLEVLHRTDDHTLSVSMLRARLTDPAIAPPEGAGLTLVARTFAPQAALMHDALLALLGLDDDEPIVSLSVMARLEALGTLERIYASAVTLTDAHDLLLHKAELYRRRFSQAMARSTVLLDLDSDGVAETRRFLGVSELMRA